MIDNIHKAAALLLVISHAVFLIRGKILLKTGKSPGPWDKLAMNASQILLPIAIISGIAGAEGIKLLHVIPGILPICMMFLLSRKSMRRKRPLLLPLLNGLFILTAFLTGVFL